VRRLYTLYRPKEKDADKTCRAINYSSSFGGVACQHNVDGNVAAGLRHDDAGQLLVDVVVVDAATFSADSVPELLYPAIVTPSLSSYAVPGFISMH